MALALAGASPPQQGATEQKPQANQPATQTRPPATLPQAKNAEPLNATCKQGEDNRASDLCAQWKAADSAYEGAIWGRRTGIATWIGLIVGAITMGAAIFAAKFAKDAAKHTETGANAADDALKHQKMMAALEMRPWVMVDSFADMKVTQGRNEKNEPVMLFHGILILRNVGRLPARDVTIQIYVHPPSTGGRIEGPAVQGMDMRTSIIETGSPKELRVLAGGPHQPGKVRDIVSMLVGISYRSINGGGDYQTEQLCWLTGRFVGETAQGFSVPFEDNVMTTAEARPMQINLMI